MPIALNMKQTTDYILRAERDNPGATVFILGPIAGWELMTLLRRSAHFYSSENGVQDPTIIRDVLRAGLRGWRNLRDAQGGECLFARDDRGRPTDPTLDVLDYTVALELMGQIISLNTLSTDERKN
jgi:hypothetical protein